jgi:ABC-2 type transport system ATP-binding protein
MPHDQIFALLGHNGAGKTTAIKMMSGMTGMTAGSVDVAGYSVSHQTSKVC